MRRIEVEIMWKGKREKVVLREPTWGEYNNALSRSVEVVSVDGVTQTRVDPFKLRKYLLLYAIERAPFKRSEREIDALPASVGELLYRELEKLLPGVEGGKN